MKDLIPQKHKKETLFSTSFENVNTTITSESGIFTAEKSPGPERTWIGPTNTGISGDHTLKVHGKIDNGGKSEAVLFDNLNVKTGKETRLTYHIFPSMFGEHYDTKYTQMYFGIDLLFNDGSRLSEYRAKDTTGTGIDPISQGKSGILYTNQWNRVNINIGEFAEGKTVDSIILRYEKPDGQGELETFFDDLEIYDQKKTIYKRPCQRVNILHGTNDSPAFSRGLTAPAVLIPQGFNMYGPCTNNASNKHYDYLSKRFDCISVSHEPSIWIDDRGTWQFSVNTSIKANSEADFSTASQENFFSHDNETALAHYYSVLFDENGKDAAGSEIEITPTSHGVCARFSFRKEYKNRNILFDCQRAAGAISFGIDGSFTALSEHKNNGSHDMFIYGEFSEIPFYTKAKGKTGIASFRSGKVEMRFATSYISYEQAKHNFNLELSGKTFEEICYSAANEWDNVLSRVYDIKGASDEQLETVYTGLYFLYKYPNTISENTGTNENPVLKYRSPYSGNVENGEMYINNGFWDTYRTVWAGYSLITPEKMTSLLNGFVQHYKNQGLIPRWSAPGGVNCMVGTSSDVIFADAAVKGFDFDIENAYLSAIKNATVYSPHPEKGGRTKLNKSIFLGYTPGDHEDFSWSIESYINDYGIARMAYFLSRKESDPKKKAKYLSDFCYFMNRSMNYVKLFDGKDKDVHNKWFRGKYENGEWTTANYHDGKFDPLFWGRDYTETDAYTMAVSVPFDGVGLANLYGGKYALAQKLDSIFETFDVYRGYGARNELEG
ncbi:MAG: glycoside hydrolase family 92 protein, partial [Clostridia bacterium]|nr:glycoside hydrolase family 92 protein [Clostridia bacterium]